jgi:hypothetical protein
MINPKMKCSTARKLVYQVLDGDLPEELQQAFEGHLERCPACAQDWEQVRADEVAFAGKVVLAPAPPDFVARVMARVRAAEVWEGADRIRVGSGRRAVPLRYALIGAASVAVLFLVLLHWPHTSPPPKIRTAEQPLVSPSPITRHPSPITHHPSPVTHHPSPITHHPSPVTHHPSPITHHPSPVTHHPSPVTRHPWSPGCFHPRRPYPSARLPGRPGGL